MKISQFIEKSLFDPELGYYRTKNPLGKSGDFITSPEISQIFGEVIALYLLNIFSSNQVKFSFVEMGAGRGTLTKDILQTIQKLAHKNNQIALNFLQKSSLNIIEINPVLQKIQKRELCEYSVNWFDNFADFSRDNKSPIFFISNELFDCFPIDQFVKTKNGWCERLIGFEDDNKLINPKFYLSDFNESIDAFVVGDVGPEVSRGAYLGSVFEYSKNARDFMAKLCDDIFEFGGIAINIDYGYFNYEFVNSLQAVKNHRKIDLFEALYEADITAHVDFMALNKIALNRALKTSLITQGRFLKNLGAIERASILAKNNPQEKNAIESALHRLIDEDKMGELFKVHIVWKE